MSARLRERFSHVWRLVAVSAALAVIAADTAPAASFPPAANGRIAFEVSDGQDDIFLGDSSAKGATDLFPGVDVEVEAPSFSPNGRQLAFTRDLGGGNEAVFVRDMKSGIVTQLTFPTNQHLDSDPSFSPDGRQIAFAGDVADGGSVSQRIFVMNADGSDRRQISSDGADPSAARPRFSPDGTRIVFRRGFTAHDIKSVGVDGSGEVNLTPGALSGETPVVSPDGSRIVFGEDIEPGAGQTLRLSVMGLSGGTPSPLTPAGITGHSPVFSPDGKSILFISDTDPGPGFSDDMLLVPSGGGTPVNLTSTPTLDEGSPDWEPVYKCAGKRATIVGDDALETIKGTKKTDVIVSNGGNDKVSGRGGNDRICGGRGNDKIGGGAGSDRLYGQQGADSLKGNGGDDLLKGGKGKDSERQ